MTAELVRGQNHPLPQVRLEVRVSAGTPIVAGVTLSDEQGRVRGSEWVAHPGRPTLTGLEVSRQAAADHRLAFGTRRRRAFPHVRTGRCVRQVHPAGYDHWVGR